MNLQVHRDDREPVPVTDLTLGLSVAGKSNKRLRQPISLKFGFGNHVNVHTCVLYRVI